MRRTPKLDPPEPAPEPLALCETCGKEHMILDDDVPSEVISHADGATTENYLCPECGEVIHSRLLREPDGV